MKPNGRTRDYAAIEVAEEVACCPVCPLSALPAGGQARVVGLACAPRVRRRLMALGVCPSAEVCVLGRAPGRGPLVIRAGTVHLMLREHEAADVHVQPETPRAAGSGDDGQP